MSVTVLGGGFKSDEGSAGQHDGRVYHFGPFRLDPAERRLYCEGSPVPITAKPFDTLLLLVQRRNRLVQKLEIMQTIWPDSFVEEGNVAVTIHALRKVLGDEGDEYKYIETVPKRGYRFIGAVNDVVETTKLPLPRRDTDSKAYLFCLEGRHFWSKRTEKGLRRSIEYFQQAITQDAHYAPAYVGLADSYVLLNAYGVEPASQAYPVAKATALKALQLDGSCAEAHAALGMVYFYYEWNWSEADKEFKRAIELNLNYPLAHSWYALYLGAMGRYDEAFNRVRNAQLLDPLSLEINTVVGRVSYLSRQYDRSIDAYRKVIDLDPSYARAHARLGMSHAAEGAFEDALREFAESQKLSDFDPYVEGLIGYAHANMGNTAKARKALGRLSQRSRRQDVHAFSMALVHIGLAEREQALNWLEKSYQDRSSYMVYAKSEPLLDPIRSEARFVALLEQMGL